MHLEIPEKYVAKWLQREFRLAELKEWIGLAKYVIAVGLVMFLSSKPPATLSELLKVIGAIGSAAGVWAGMVAVRNYKKKTRHDDD